MHPQGMPTVSLADIVARKNLPANFDVANTEVCCVVTPGVRDQYEGW